jgi:hypothetical protein
MCKLLCSQVICNFGDYVILLKRVGKRFFSSWLFLRDEDIFFSDKRGIFVEAILKGLLWRMVRRTYLWPISNKALI